MTKMVVVTGAGSGIGAAAARAFAGEGHRVVVADIDESAAAAVAGEIGPAAVPCPVDVREDASVRAMFESAIGAFGRIDVVCVNAGAAWNDPAVDRLTGGFMSGTTDTIEVAFVRPRERWWPRFQLAAGETINAGLGRGAAPRDVDDDIEELYRELVA